jgi:serine/threonine-protein kinase
MARILHYAAGHQYTTIHLSFQLAEKKIFQNLEKFLQWFCANISYSLGLPNQLEDYWDEFLGSKVNCKAYFEQYLLAEIERPVVLGLDEVDLVFSYPEIAEDFLSLLRAWHEEAKRRDVWKKLRLVVVHSTEVYLPMDINQSPFNVGLPIDLPEFDREQVGVLAGKYGLNWENERVEKLMKLVGGHPYLVRLALYHIANKDITLEELIKNGAGENNLYSDHLKRHLWNLEKYPSLLEGIKQISISDTPVRLSSEQAFKLDSMGLIKFQGNEVIFRCQLYQRFFKKISEKI